MRIKNIFTEYQECPLGIDTPAPRFSWQIQSEEKETVQTAYAVSVSSPEGTVWSTGTVRNERSHLVPYEGAALAAETRYRVLVSVTDNHGRTAETESWFETGLMEPEKMAGIWITHAYADDIKACPVFISKFSTLGPGRNVKKARLYASALGVYQVEINEKRVGNMFMAPGWTSYQSRIQYQTYDVTALLEKENKLEITVGNGWYKGELGFMIRNNIYGRRTAVIAQLEIEYDDGSRETVKTDEGWHCTTGSRRFSEIYHGETIDYTYEPEEVSRVVAFDYPKEMLTAQECEPVRITKRLRPRQLITTPKGETVLDFGQNLVGVVEAVICRPRGTAVVLKHAEVLDKEGNFYTENLRSARATDTFICSGGEDTFLPAFTFHGFRYVKIEGLGTAPELDQFTACVLHSDMRVTGSFQCSHPGVNQLQSNIQWGQRGNFLDIPTDCPQRNERLGWTGDAQVFARTAAYNMNVAGFFGKWLRDLAAEQTLEHGVTDVVPNILGTRDGTAAWGDAATVIPWTMYLTYGDTKILRDQYPSMKNWVAFIRSKATKNLWQTGFQYGDWLALDKEEGPGRTGATDIYLIASAFFAYSTEITAQAAEVLGYGADAAELRALHKEIVTNFQEEYITQSGRIVSETQTGCILPLYFKLAREKDRQRILSSLIDNLKKHNNHLTTGFVGTPYLCHTLSENGYHDIAGKVFLKRDFPSWLYSVDRGATTIWERWNSMKEDGSFDESGMNSFNHYAYGSIGDWMYQKLAGLQIIEPGYKRSRVAPMPIQGITWVKAALETPYGLLAVKWECKKGHFIMDVEIPANTTAVIVLPGKDEEIEAGSGCYRYEYETGMALELQRYSMDSTLKEIMDNKLAMTMLTELMPGMTDNPMIKFVMDNSITELAANMPPQSVEAFEKILVRINAAEDV